MQSSSAEDSKCLPKKIRQKEMWLNYRLRIQGDPGKWFFEKLTKVMMHITARDSETPNRDS